MRSFISLFLLAALFACEPQSVTEKEVNAKYKSIKRKWQFVSMETVGDGADSVRIQLVSASVSWEGSRCNYSDESGKYSYCSGDGDVNGEKFSLLFGYDATDGKYMLLPQMPVPITDEQRLLEKKLKALINGRWEFEVNGETWTARQVSNERLPGVLTILRAHAL